MGPSGPPTPVGGVQSVSTTIMQSNSAILGPQGGLMPPQATFSLAPTGAQYKTNFPGNASNIFSHLQRTLGNGSSNFGLSSFGSTQLESVDMTGESDPILAAANEVGCTASPSSRPDSALSAQLQSQHIFSPSANQILLAQYGSQVRQYESHNIQHEQQFPNTHSQPQRQHRHFRSIRGELSNIRPVKLEPHTMDEQVTMQQVQSLCNLGPRKLQLQQNQIGRGTRLAKLEHQRLDQAIPLQRQQQHQQMLLHLSRHSSEAAHSQMNLFQEQHLLHLQQLLQQQQEQLQLEQQFQQQNLSARSATKPIYEPGMCAWRLTQYMYQQHHRPNDNNIEFWQKFVAEFFAPNGKKRWCVSLYGNSRQTNGVFPQDLWHCEICNRRPGRGFETTVEVLPRLFKIKYDSGTLEELLYIDMPREYQNARGQIVLDYAKATQESVFEHLRVVRDGHLRIVFTPDLKICSWEFCARRHEELVPRRWIIPQVNQLGAAAQRYQASVSAQNSSSNLSGPDLLRNCNMFVTYACQLAKSLDVPLVNDLGYTKRYVRCLQISEVVNMMKDLIDYSHETRKGPMESLAKFPRRSSSFSVQQNSAHQSGERHQPAKENLNQSHYSAQASVLQPTASNVIASVNSQATASPSTSATALAGPRCQNSINSHIDNQINTPNSPYTGAQVQIPSAGSSTTLPPAQLNPSSPFSCPTPSSSVNPLQNSNHMTSANSTAHIPPEQSSHSNEDDPNESHSSVEKIMQEIMISSQFSGPASMVGVGSSGNKMKLNGDMQLCPSLPSSHNCLAGNGIFNNSSGVCGGDSRNLSGVRVAMENNSATPDGMVGISSMSQDSGNMNHQQQELATQFLNGIGAGNVFDYFPFDWKSP